MEDYLMKRSLLLLLFAVSLLAATCAYGQSAILDLPRQSQHAVVMQRVGMTDITINYHRPLVNKRKVFGTLEPYGKVWRAGANENTTIQFSTPVTVEGKPLDKGIYGLHMIPTEKDWTVIFSKNATSWGSFTYDQAEDALRVTVHPQTAEMREALTYDFDDPTLNAVTVTLRWDKIAVPFKVEANTAELVQASLHNQLRGRAKYEWSTWDEAAGYLLDHKLSAEEALNDAEESIQVEQRFENLVTKARALDALNRQEEAATTRSKAVEMGTAIQLHVYGRQLQIAGKQEEAFHVFRDNIKRNPAHWVAHNEQARMACAQKDFDGAVKEMKLAVASAPDPQKSGLEGLVRRLEAKEDINK